MQGGELQERQPGLDRALDKFPLVLIHRIPFVDREHHGPAILKNVARNVGVLIGDPLSCINQQQHDVG